LAAQAQSPASSARVVAAAAYNGAPLADLKAQGALEIEGDHGLARRFLKLFPLPSTASGG
jgi:hypothetical protein